MIDAMFEQAEDILDEMDKICPSGFKERRRVFENFKNNICGNTKKITAKNKKNMFSVCDDAIDRTVLACPQTKELAERLKALLGGGMTVKCGGP